MTTQERETWNNLHRIAADEELSLRERLAAFDKMNDLTGEDDPVTEEALRDYLKLTI